MPTTVLLARHAAHPLLGRVLCGRMAGVALGEAGERQAARLGQRLARERPVTLYTSRVQRAVETASAIGAACGLAPVPCDALAEIDFGGWTGAAFADLAGDPEWQRWNAARGTARPPGGEAMQEVQDRVVAGLRRMHARHPDALVVAVSHADVIKSALLWCLRAPLGAHAQFEIGPASLSALVLWEDGAKILWLNEAVA